MSEDGSGYVDSPALLEGDLIKKEDINATADAWNYVEERVSDINIREEGLSRVNFEPSTWRSNFLNKTHCNRSGFKSISTPKIQDGWTYVPFYSVEYGTNTTYAEIEFDWEPQKDTYAIIRASFSFRFDVGMLGGNGRPISDVDCADIFARDWQKFRFGLLIYKADETSLNEKTRTPINPTGNVFSPVQIHLNPDFAQTANGRRGPIRFAYDRRSRLTGTITLLAAGQSWENEHCRVLENNEMGIDLREPGPYRARIVWRSQIDEHADHTSGLGQTDDGGYSGTEIKCDVGRMNMFVQVHRR